MSHLHNNTYTRAACSSCDNSTNVTNVPPTRSDGEECGAIGGRSPLASLTNLKLSPPQSLEAAATHFRDFPRGNAGRGNADGPTRRSRVTSRKAPASGGGSPLLTNRTTGHDVIGKNRKRHKQGKENAGLERRHLTTAAAPFSDTPTRWLDDSNALVVADVGGAAGCDEQSPPAQQRRQQLYCTCELHGGSSPAHVPEESAAMIGDYTAPCCLPPSKNLRREIQYISPATAADLLRGQFDDVIESFHIVDCRYPYEYAAGHIQGAENICTEEQLTLRFMKEPLNRGTHCRTWQKNGKRRHVIVFHCEFSSYRAPKMCTLLRRLDREQNMCNYPGLYYPEMYVIEGGYMAFFNKFRELCDPQDYKPMRGPEYEKYRSSKEHGGAAGKESRRHRKRPAMQDGCPPPMLQFDEDDDP